MKSNGMQLTVLHGLLAEEINPFIAYAACPGACDGSDHTELHKAILKMMVIGGAFLVLGRNKSLATRYE